MARRLARDRDYLPPGMGVFGLVQILDPVYVFVIGQVIIPEIAETGTRIAAEEE